MLIHFSGHWINPAQITRVFHVPGQRLTVVMSDGGSLEVKGAGADEDFARLRASTEPKPLGTFSDFARETGAGLVERPPLGPGALPPTFGAVTSSPGGQVPEYIGPFDPKTGNVTVLPGDRRAVRAAPKGAKKP